MCGRYALGLPVRTILRTRMSLLKDRTFCTQHDEIAQMHGYNVQIGEWVGQDQFQPR